MKKIADFLLYIFVPLAIFRLWVKFIDQISYLDFKNDPLTFHSLCYNSIITPLWEEAFFRYVPLQLLTVLPLSIKEKIILPFVIIISLIFAYSHGSYIENIAIHGVLGMFLCWLFIHRGFWYAVIFHSLYNISIHFLN